jgi:galactose oxidase
MPQVRSPGTLAVSLLAVSLLSCRDDVRPGPLEGGLSQLSLSYVCANDYDIRNQSQSPLTVRYSVVGAAEDGELVLPGRTGQSESTTRLTTLHRGAVQIFEGEQESSPVANLATACPLPPTATEPQATSGEWSAPFSWPIVAVHLHLLPNGRVLSWGKIGDPEVWDPATGNFRAVPSTTMVFCSGHAFLPDGRLLVTGGHLDDERGLRDVNIFDGSVEAWTPVQPMSRARWYPTSTTLAEGEVLTLAGTDERGLEVETPEVWTGTGWRSLEGARRILPYYPRTFVAPNGLVFYAGELAQSAYLDPNGAGRWTPVATSNYGRRDYGSAVMYRPGKVMIVGGSNQPDGTPTATAEVIDLNQPIPSWRYTDPMTHPRRQLNATLLPDGEVLVTGGTTSAGFSERAGAVHAPELWDPATGRWSVLASNQVTRVYHSTTLLLPDGRILSTGSGDGPGLPRELNAEIFSPPYLFRGARPFIAEAPAEVAYGQSFFVATPDAGRIARVSLVRLSSVTHAFDQNQRFSELSFRKTAGGLTVAAPETGTVAPPGHYLLFILDGNAVPSTAKIIRIKP